MDRVWPWALIFIGAAVALSFARTDQVLEAREREGLKLRALRKASAPPGIRRCGTPDPPRNPSRLECGVGAAFGVELVLFAVCVLTRRAGRWPGRLFWTRGSGSVKVLWTASLLVGVVVQLRLLLALADAPEDPELFLWSFALAPTFLVPFVGLAGSVLAKVNVEASPQR